jgi:hypothetical protein
MRNMDRIIISILFFLCIIACECENPFGPSDRTLSMGIRGEGIVIITPNQDKYKDGTKVRLEAVPDTGWNFTQWKGDLTGVKNPTELVMDSDKSVTAVFGQDLYFLMVEEEGNGSVTWSPQQDNYTYGTQVKLTATPEEGWVFSHWEGDLYGSENPITIIMDSEKSVMAVFVRPITTFWYPGGAGSYWVFDVSDSVQSRAEVAGTVEINGLEYKRVVEEEPILIGLEPFLVFRVTGNSTKIRGYAKNVNDEFVSLIVEIFRNAGLPTYGLNIIEPSEEWVMLVSPEVGQLWTVMELEIEYRVSFGTKVTGTLNIEANIPQKEEITTQAGSFEAYKTDYTMNYVIESMIDWEIRDRETDTKYLINEWLARDVGAVKMQLSATSIASLVEYNLTPGQMLAKLINLPSDIVGIKRQAGSSSGNVYQARVTWIEESFATRMATMALNMINLNGG